MWKYILVSGKYNKLQRFFNCPSVWLSDRFINALAAHSDLGSQFFLGDICARMFDMFAMFIWCSIRSHCGLQSGGKICSQHVFCAFAARCNF